MGSGGKGGGNACFNSFLIIQRILSPLIFYFVLVFLGDKSEDFDGFDLGNQVPVENYIPPESVM